MYFSREDIMIPSHRAPALTALSILALALIAACASEPKGEEKPDAIASVSLVAEAERPILADLEPVRGGGKTLVVYYSMGNASERVARDLAELHSADVERIVESKARRWSFMSGGAAASFGLTVRIQTPRFDPSAYDRVFVLSPVWAWRMAPPVRSWLKMHAGRLPEVAYATISGDTEPEKIVAKMAKVGKRESFAFAGFSERDFSPENRAVYVGKIKRLCGLAPSE